MNEKNSLQAAIEEHGGQRLIETISFVATIITTAISVYQDLDESVIALVKGDYYEQIKVIMSRIGTEEEDYMPFSGPVSFAASVLRRTKSGIQQDEK